MTFSTSFPPYTYTNFPFELLNSTYLLTKYLYVYLFSCRTIKIELFPSKYLLLPVRIRTVFRARIRVGTKIGGPNWQTVGPSERNIWYDALEMQQANKRRRTKIKIHA